MRRHILEILSRITLAVERGGGDHIGDHHTILKDLDSLLNLIPEPIRFAEMMKPMEPSEPQERINHSRPHSKHNRRRGRTPTVC